MAERAPSTAGTLAYILAGQIVWAMHLLVVYGGHATVCATGGRPALTAWLVAAATALAALAVAGLLIAPARVARRLGLGTRAEGRRNYDALGRTLNGLALLAILWTGATAVVVSTCLSAR